LPGLFYIKWKEGKESGIAERPRERVCVREAERCGKRKIASPIKLTVRENKHVIEICD
jgi:hypothetical protein